MPELEILGHRGDGRGLDENTLASCRRALEKGAVRLELDVQLIGGELQLVHPGRPVGDSLAHLLDHIGDIPLILHLKRRRFSPRHDRRAVRRLVPLIAGRDAVVLSMWPGTLTYLRRHFPTVRRAFGTGWAWYDLLFARRLATHEYVSRHWILGRRMMARARRGGVNVIVYTQRNDEVMYRKLTELGVTSVMTDDVAWWTARAGRKVPGP